MEPNPCIEKVAFSDRISPDAIQVCQIEIANSVDAGLGFVALVACGCTVYSLNLYRSKSSSSTQRVFAYREINDNKFNFPKEMCLNVGLGRLLNPKWMVRWCWLMVGWFT